MSDPDFIAELERALSDAGCIGCTIRPGERIAGFAPAMGRRVSFFGKRVGAVEARGPHTLKVAGSIPAPATNFPTGGHLEDWDTGIEFDNGLAWSDARPAWSGSWFLGAWFFGSALAVAVAVAFWIFRALP